MNKILKNKLLKGTAPSTYCLKKKKERSEIIKPTLLTLCTSTEFQKGQGATSPT